MVTEALERIGRLDPALGAVVMLRSDAALAQAAARDDARDARTPGPLWWLPVLVKVLHAVAGLSTCQGSRLLSGAAPVTRDGVTPSRLTRAGAIVVGKSTLPEFATEGFTAGPLTGTTRNQWDVRYSPGGSSGGSAAAVSAGMVPIATATDDGGSIRIPAAYCGLVGIKPSGGVVPREVAPDWIDLSTDGPLATRVDDLAVLLDVTGHPG